MDGSAACRVVICDDSAEYRTVLALMLRRDANVEVVGEAADGADAVELVRREQPDALLLDVSMPRVDGIDAIPAIREAAPRCRIIMLTGFGSPAVRERALAAGAAAYLEKHQDFATIVAEVVDGQAPAAWTR